MTTQSYSDLYEDALRLAAVAHDDQPRKGTTIPYIIHPVHVSIILLQHGFPTEVAIAGLLHDVVEDRDVPLSQLGDQFGDQVAEMVAALSERKKDAEGKDRPWEIRKQEGLEQLRRASPEAVAVKTADTLHSARCIALDVRREGPTFWQRFNCRPEQQLNYYRQIAQVAQGRLLNHPLVDELASAVEDMARAMKEAGLIHEDALTI